MIAQAMPVLEQQQGFVGQIGGGQRAAPGQTVIGRAGEQEFIRPDGARLDHRRLIGQGHEGGIQAPLAQGIEQALGQVFAQEDFQLGKLVAQGRQDTRQQEGRNRGDHAQLERPIQRFARGLGGDHQIFCLGHHPARALEHDLAGRCQHRAAGTALDQHRAQCHFQFLDRGA